MQPDRTAAIREPTAHRFVPKIGYVRVGQPMLPVKHVANEGACTPPMGTEWDTLHLLRPPHKGAPDVALMWTLQGWMPELGRGKRLAFTAKYLAAHGWLYIGSL